MRALKEELVVSPCDIKVPVDQYMQFFDQGMRGLTDQERQVIFLRFWEALSITQIADRTNATWDSTNLLIDLAVEKIRSSFREQLNSRAGKESLEK